MKWQGFLLLLLILALPGKAFAKAESTSIDAQGEVIMAASTNGDNGDEELNIREFILDHLADDYEWNSKRWNRHLTISLPNLSV